MLKLEAVALHLFCLGKRCIEVAKVLCVEECIHNIIKAPPPAPPPQGGEWYAGFALFYC
jgi:hypothetical protein